MIFSKWKEGWTSQLFQITVDGISIFSAALNETGREFRDTPLAGFCPWSTCQLPPTPEKNTVYNICKNQSNANCYTHNEFLVKS